MDGWMDAWMETRMDHWTNKRLHPFPVREGGAPQVSLQGLTSVLLDISDVVAELPPTNGGPHPVPSGTEWHLFLSRRTGD